MPEVVSRFVNVDLDIKSPTDLTALIAAFARRAMVIHSGRSGRRYWVRLELVRHPKNPDEGIKRLLDLASSLRDSARVAWANSTKEFDIGIEGGTEPGPAEWLVRPRTLQAAARADAQLRFTVYPASLTVNRKKARRLAG